MGLSAAKPVVRIGKIHDADFVTRLDAASFPAEVGSSVSFSDPERIRQIVNNPKSLHRLLRTDNGFMIYTPWPSDPGVIYISAWGGEKSDKNELVNFLKLRARRLYTHAAVPTNPQNDPFGYNDFIRLGFVQGLAGNPAEEPAELEFSDYIRRLVTLTWTYQ